MTTNTDRLIATYEQAEREGYLPVRFMAGRWTGNSPAVIPALRRRGYKVERDGCQWAITGRTTPEAHP
jgi:hypothetical protein